MTTLIQSSKADLAHPPIPTRHQTISLASPELDARVAASTLGVIHGAAVRLDEGYSAEWSVEGFSKSLKDWQKQVRIEKAAKLAVRKPIVSLTTSSTSHSLAPSSELRSPLRSSPQQVMLTFSDDLPSEILKQRLKGKVAANLG